MKLVLPEVQASRIEKISHDILPLYNLNIKIYVFASFLLNFNSSSSSSSPSPDDDRSKGNPEKCKGDVHHDPKRNNGHADSPQSACVKAAICLFKGKRKWAS